MEWGKTWEEENCGMVIFELGKREGEDSGQGPKRDGRIEDVEGTEAKGLGTWR